MKGNDVIKHILHDLVPLCILIFIVTIGCNSSSSSSSVFSAEGEIPGESISFLGDTFFRRDALKVTFQHDDSLLQEAKDMFTEDSTDLNNIIWYGRRLAYMDRYKDAIAVFSGGIRYHSDVPELYRHRGHLYITSRQLDHAIDDLKQAAVLAKNRKIETEPDCIPNKLDIPLSNLHFNIYYHLGLAYYLKADDQKAIEAYQQCMKYADNPDLKVATSYWLYLAYRRAGDKISASKLLTDLHPDMEIIENDAYLKLLLMFKSENKSFLLPNPLVDSTINLTDLYGISCWFDLNGRSTDAAILRHMILSSGNWPDFGFIAAEADSSRLLAH